MTNFTEYYTKMIELQCKLEEFHFRFTNLEETGNNNKKISVNKERIKINEIQNAKKKEFEKH